MNIRNECKSCWDKCKLCWIDCGVVFRKTRFLWIIILVAFVILWSLLFISELLCGETKEEVAYLGPKALSTLDLSDPPEKNAQYILLKSCKWRELVMENFPKGLKQIVNLAGDSLYITAISFTTIGFGDIEPSTVVGRGITFLDAVLGFFALGLLVNVLMNGLRRYI